MYMYTCRPILKIVKLDEIFSLSLVLCVGTSDSARVTGSSRAVDSGTALFSLGASSHVNAPTSNLVGGGVSGTSGGTPSKPIETFNDPSSAGT